MAYATNFLKQVILRLDFAPLAALYSDKQPAYSEQIKDAFPHVKGQQRSQFVFAIGGASSVEQQKMGWQWQHGDSEDDKKRRLVTVASDFFSMEAIGAGTYTGFADFRHRFVPVYDKFVVALGVREYTRIGLRFINEFLIPEEGDALIWNGLLAADLATGVKPGFANGIRMTRSMHQVTGLKDDISVVASYGLHNPDYPNPIVRRQFVLDLDSSVSGGIAEAEAKRKIDALYDVGRDIFEASIDTGIRERMGAGA
jgi:uncharacterized protein (TIGR04255 family)